MPTQVPAVDIYAGDTVQFPTYTFVDDQGEARNLSTYTFTAKWRAHAAASEAIDLTVDQTNKATGVVGVSASATQTRDMAGSGVWDLQGTVGAVVETFVYGPTVWTQDVTR